MSIDVQNLTLPIGAFQLEGSLLIPTDAVGLVLFAHGGSSRHSPRNRHVATQLNERRLATLLFDLLTAEEEQRDELDASLRFDVDLLATRLVAATDLVPSLLPTPLPIGYFGGSTGAAAALIAAARRPAQIAAVVERNLPAAARLQLLQRIGRGEQSAPAP